MIENRLYPMIKKTRAQTLERSIETAALFASLAINAIELHLNADLKTELITTAITIGLGVLRVAREGSINSHNFEEYQKQLRIMSN